MIDKTSLLNESNGFTKLKILKSNPIHLVNLLYGLTSLRPKSVRSNLNSLTLCCVHVRFTGHVKSCHPYTLTEPDWHSD